MKKFLPYSTQFIDSADHKAVQAVLKSGWLTQGPTVAKFEKQLAKMVQAKYAVAVSNGTAALHILALAIGLKKGDEVITTPNSFLATANAVLYADAKPVFADVCSDTGCIDPQSIQNKITKKSRAIFISHHGGAPVKLREIRNIARKNRLTLIEDAAHALGAKYQTKPIGSCEFSKAAIFSFHPVKHITTAEGGAITTNDRALYKKLLLLRSHGVTKEPSILKNKKEGRWYYEMQSLGFNYRLSDLQAALGLTQIKKLKSFISGRRKVASEYAKQLKGYDLVKLPPKEPGHYHAYHLFQIRLNHPKLIKNRSKIFDDLISGGVGCQIHYIPINAQPYYKKLGYKAQETPEAMKFYKSVLSIPCYPKMTKSDVSFVCSVLKKVLKKYV